MTWFFSFELLEENKQSSVIFHPNVFEDGYGQPNVSGFANSKKLFRATTRSDLLDAWWSFDRDTPRSTQVRSDDTNLWSATLYDAWVTARGKFGQGLAFDKSSGDGRMKVEPNGIPLSDNGWTLSLWGKNLLPPSQTGQSTLFRGQDKQNETESDHYLVLRGSDQLLGFIDGDEPATDQQF